MTVYQRIKMLIKQEIDKGNKKFIIFPFGEIGMLTKQILNENFGINETLVIDNGLCEVNNNIKALNFLEYIDVDKYIVLFGVLNTRIKENLKEQLLKYCKEDNVVEIFVPTEKTKCGKYTYGPLCNHFMVESIGAFSSVAYGVDVVPNHPMQYISTHPLLYMDKSYIEFFEYENGEEEKWFFKGVDSKGVIPNLKRITIGNDVWIGRNVSITNSANIGNGVIVGAGAVVTKDVPDYAVVVGVPARIIRYRYTSDQIEKLNKVAWWDWPDEKIREYYDDFFLNIDEFLQKHYREY